MSTRVKCPNCGCIIKPQILAFLILLGIAGFSRADSIIPTDKAAHFGVSYALQTVGYGTLKSRGFDKTDSIIPNKGDVLANTLGQAAAVTTIITFDF